MNKTLFAVSILAAIGSSACGSKANPCADYVTSVEACYGADLPAVGFDEATLCAGTAGIAATYYSCLADAYDAGDCTTADGITAVATASALCVP